MSKEKSLRQRQSGSSAHFQKVPKPHLYINKIANRLTLARKKLLPVINEILKTASENASRMPNQSVKSYHLTMEQYKDAIWASQVLKEVNEILKFNKVTKRFNTPFKPENFNLDTKNIKVNKSGKIYVDTPILVQLIDLHNILGDIIDYLRDMPAEGHKAFGEEYARKVNSQKPKPEGTSSESVETKKKEEVEKITKEILTTLTLPLNTNFLVMAANSFHRSRSKMPVLPEERSASEINLGNHSASHVRQTKSTGSVMNTSHHSKVVDALAARDIIIRCLEDLDIVKQFLEQQEAPSRRRSSDVSFEDEVFQQHEEGGEDEEGGPCICCDCDESEPLNFVWKEDENGSKLIICIKGKTEEEGDIHVVIRQCPDCLHSKKSGNHMGVSTENFHKPPPSRAQLSHKNLLEERAVSRGDARRRSSDTDPINVFFDPDEPAQSIVEGPHIRMFETINLNLQNTEGQDLVISLSVRPKHPHASGINLDRIFSESRTNFNHKGHRDHHRVVERVIPLSRTKICSSMEFDVDLVQSKLRMKGARHPDPLICERLNDLGASNILRASRPVKCGRKAILNEPPDKFLPYSASLRSLPLDDLDLATINQSLNMSLHRSRHSKIIFPIHEHREFIKNRHVQFQKCVGFFQIFKQEKGFFDVREIAKIFIKMKLSYYIYLEDDIQTRENSYEIRYFDAVDNNKNSDTDKTDNKESENVANSDGIKQYGNSAKCGQKSKIPIYIKHCPRNTNISETDSGNCQKGIEADISNTFDINSNSDPNSHEIITVYEKNKDEYKVTSSSEDFPSPTESLDNKINTDSPKISSDEINSTLTKKSSNIDEENNIYYETTNDPEPSTSYKNYNSEDKIKSNNNNEDITINNNTSNETTDKCEEKLSFCSISNTNNEDINTGQELLNGDTETRKEINKSEDDNVNIEIASRNEQEFANDNTSVCDVSSKCFGDIRRTLKVNCSLHKINSRGDLSSLVKINNEDQKLLNKDIEIVVNSVHNKNIPLNLLKEDGLVDKESKKRSEQLGNLPKEDKLDKESKKGSGQPSLVTIKRANIKMLGDDNSLASLESIEAFNAFLKKFKSSNKSCLKERKKKKEFYSTRSNSQLLVDKQFEKKAKPIDFRFRVLHKKKPYQQKSEGRCEGLALSSTRFKRNINLEETLSKMIVNNFSNFLYEAIIRDLSSEAKIEVLSKIDEFLGKYCKLQAMAAQWPALNLNVVKMGHDLEKTKIPSLNVFGRKKWKMVVFCIGLLSEVAEFKKRSSVARKIAFPVFRLFRCNLTFISWIINGGSQNAHVQLNI